MQIDGEICPAKAQKSGEKYEKKQEYFLGCATRSE